MGSSRSRVSGCHMKHLGAETANAPSAASPITIREMGERDRETWDRFVLGCSDGTFFHLSGWRRIMQEIFRHRALYLLAERAGDIVGVLPVAEVKSSLFGHSVVSLPFCVYGGCAVTDSAAIPLLHARAWEFC